MKQEQEMNDNQNEREFTTIRISREVYNDLSKRGWYKATHSDILSKILLQTKESKLDPPLGEGSW